jgi:NADH-quinone oxidoreductase subunit C
MIKMAEFEIKILVSYMLLSLSGLKRILLSKQNVLIVEVCAENVHDVIFHLKNNQQLRFDSLLDIWGVDYIGSTSRFEVNYLLLSTTNQIRVIVRAYISENGGLKSVTSLFKSAAWLEREVWDMYGVLFFENLDLRRILTDYGFEGHPLRKDFPLSGFSEVRYDDGDKRVVYEPLEVSQEYRSFSFKNPWGQKT